MADDPEHKLTHEYKNNTFTGRCSCGGWVWDAPLTYGLSPSQAFKAIEEDHRRHVEEAEGRPPSTAS